MINCSTATFKTKKEIIEALNYRSQDQKQLFELACRCRNEFFDRAVTIRGLIELSSYCQKKCHYCAMRCANSAQTRFRLTRKNILESIGAILQQSIETVFLQSGQDPLIDPLVESVLDELQNAGLRVILCLGERSLERYRRFAQRGALGYIIKFESSNEKYFHKITHSSLKSRLQCIKDVRQAGLLLGTGFIASLPGQNLEMLAEDILLCAEIQPDFASVSPFAPNENTPFQHKPAADIDMALNSLALLRILLSHAFIPTVSVFEKLRKGGQLDGFKAGANVITVNFTPSEYRDAYPIYSKKRFVVNVDHALSVIDQAGLNTCSLK